MGLIDPKIHPKWGVGGFIFGGRGLHFGAILGVWADSGFQSRLGKRLGWLLGDYRGQDGLNLGAKMVPSWSQNGTKIDAEIDSIMDAILNRF